MNNLSNNKVSIVTVTIENENNAPESCRDEILEKVLQTYGTKDIILFPAGFYSSPAEETKVVDNVSKLLAKTGSETVVCLGIDICEKYKKNVQFAIAINKSGIVAKGQKFYPAKAEKDRTVTAKSFDGKERFFECKGKRFYLAVCYDVFGIRKRRIANPGVDAILNPVHFFNKKGEGAGFVFFIRYGFGGASLHWNCPVFGAAVFLGRKVPPKWQTSFLCKNKIENLQSIKYSDNGLKPDKQDCNISTACEKAVCRLYSI
ncbi:MAG: hypothetical protein LBQ22_04970 [Bacteroidales bacterium]|jgi:hypothetical protein|nr:hypothetical protein [Bacteroidales bacterium]